MKIYEPFCREMRHSRNVTKTNSQANEINSLDMKLLSLSHDKFMLDVILRFLCLTAFYCSFILINYIIKANYNTLLELLTEYDEISYIV